RLPEVVGDGERVRHRRRRNDDDHLAAVLRRGPRTLALVARRGGGARGSIPPFRRFVPRGQPGEDRVRWLGAGRARHDHLYRDDHLAARTIGSTPTSRTEVHSNW